MIAVLWCNYNWTCKITRLQGSLIRCIMHVQAENRYTVTMSPPPVAQIQLCCLPDVYQQVKCWLSPVPGSPLILQTVFLKEKWEHGVFGLSLSLVKSVPCTVRCSSGQAVGKLHRKFVPGSRVLFCNIKKRHSLLPFQLASQK